MGEPIMVSFFGIVADAEKDDELNFIGAVNEFLDLSEEKQQELSEKYDVGVYIEPHKHSIHGIYALGTLQNEHGPILVAGESDGVGYFSGQIEYFMREVLEVSISGLCIGWWAIQSHN